MDKKKCTAVVLAAGSGKRMGGNVAKQYLFLGDRPVLWYALQAFEQNAIIDDVILVVGQGEIPFCTQEIVERYHFEKITVVIEGGAERYLSVKRALDAIEERAGSALDPGVPDSRHSGYVFIHDGARPFVTGDMIRDTYEAAVKYGACVAAMPVKDTIKLAEGVEFAAQPSNRKQVWAVQTPQVFETPLICEAYRRLAERLPALHRDGIEITDDAMVVETMLGRRVKLVRGDYRNMKLTTPEDMAMAEALLQSMHG
ncbi:MAG: 2-C-methyl-D-erythritol 4-phosphate cytidylyltransferase [Lachnospiraceae bacterium]|nr:2-C-methyl-D-erythritol 4-phosphate cytidylyltransferase [Lachnospiraceae bacterium]